MAFTPGTIPRRFATPVLLLLVLGGCTRQPPPIKVGFIAGLSGRVADLGVSGRDGALLAVEQRNAGGGIGGRPVELLVRDDRQEPDAAREAVGELADAGVVALVGPMTSSMATACAREAASRDLVLVSPTTSTNELTGLDDHFFRVYPPSSQAAAQLAEHVRTRMGLERAAVVYDQGNRAHTESWFQHFREELEQRGGAVTEVLPFTSGGAHSFTHLAKQAAGADAEVLFVLANAMDTAMFCQRLRLAGHQIPVVASEWSATEDLLQFGGHAVEGLQFLHTLQRDSQAPRYQAFREAFRARFGHEAGFASVHAFDAAHLLFEVLEKTGGAAEGLRGQLSGSAFQGLQSEIRMDRFGDPVREHYPMVVRNGAFVELAR